MNKTDKQPVMRPQDIVILLKKLTTQGRKMNGKELASSLNISAAEISMSMERNRVAQLVDQTKKNINILSLLDFIVHGLRYCFPAQPGRIVRGIPTASSAAPLKDLLTSSNETYVWKDPYGTVRGQAVTPLFQNVIRSATEDPEFYSLLALVDSIRIGKSREKQLAVESLEKYFRSYDSEK